MEGKLNERKLKGNAYTQRQDTNLKKQLNFTTQKVKINSRYVSLTEK